MEKELRIRCPECGTDYPASRLYADVRDAPDSGLQYTVVCVVCGTQFDVIFEERPSRRRLFFFASPPFLTYRYSSVSHSDRERGDVAPGSRQA